MLILTVLASYKSRRKLWRDGRTAFTAALLSCLLWGTCPLAQPTEAVSHVSLTVSSLEAIVPFYTEVLTFEEVERYDRRGPALQRLYGLRNEELVLKIAVLRLRQEQIELLEFVNEDGSRAIPAGSRSHDLWFQHMAIVVRDMEAAYARLRAYRVQHVSTAPQTLPDYLPAAAGISAFYFRDPDGHNLEIIHFPEGKGDPRWQAGAEALFLGLDHTAIGVADTDRSLGFYQGLLGLSVAGNSENYGNEQEHLNQVFGAHLLITGLKAPAGLGVELLDYLAPPGGRLYPADSRATDLWHWHSTLLVEDIEAVYQQVQAANYFFISRGLTEIRGRASFLVRDPDGHAVLLQASP